MWRMMRRRESRGRMPLEGRLVLVTRDTYQGVSMLSGAERLHCDFKAQSLVVGLTSSVFPHYDTYRTNFPRGDTRDVKNRRLILRLTTAGKRFSPPLGYYEMLAHFPVNCQQHRRAT